MYLLCTYPTRRHVQFVASLNVLAAALRLKNLMNSIKSKLKQLVK